MVTGDRSGIFPSKFIECEPNVKLLICHFIIWSPERSVSQQPVTGVEKGLLYLPICSIALEVMVGPAV